MSAAAARRSLAALAALSALAALPLLAPRAAAAQAPTPAREQRQRRDAQAEQQPEGYGHEHASAPAREAPACYALAWIGGQAGGGPGAGGPSDSLPDLLLLDTLPPAPGVAADRLGGAAMRRATYFWRRPPGRRTDAVWLRTAASEILLLDPTPTSPVGMVEAALVGEGLVGRASGPAERMIVIRGTRAPCPRRGEDRES